MLKVPDGVEKLYFSCINYTVGVMLGQQFWHSNLETLTQTITPVHGDFIAGIMIPVLYSNSLFCDFRKNLG